MENMFRVYRRNYGHWDIANSDGRIFRIRGGPGKYVLIDERPQSLNKDTQIFKTLTSCMSFVTDLLMHELIIVDGQEPNIIESWNI